MKYTIKEKSELTRVYVIEAENPEDALDKMYSGIYDPEDCNEEGGDVFIYDDKGKNVTFEEHPTKGLY